MLKEIRNEKDISDLVREIGFLPFFANGIKGFSIEECCLPELWFSDSADGPWEWKGPVIRTGNCVYGKLFCGKAGFISREWLPDFANFRRDGYDFDTRCDEGTAPHKDIAVYDTVAQKGAVLSKELKRLGNYRKGGNTGFERLSRDCRCRPTSPFPTSSTCATNSVSPTAGELRSTLRPKRCSATTS